MQIFKFDGYNVHHIKRNIEYFLIAVQNIFQYFVFFSNFCINIIVPISSLNQFASKFAVCKSVSKIDSYLLKFNMFYLLVILVVINILFCWLLTTLQ